jgi:hypothetical protein
MRIACYHCSRFDEAPLSDASGFRDVQDVRRDFSGARFTHLGLCPECQERERPKPWEPPQVGGRLF